MNDRAIEPQRLDLVLAETLSEQTAPAYVQEFEALLRARRSGSFRLAATSLHDEIVDFVMPRITDPSIFQGGRLTAILGELKERVGIVMAGENILPDVEGLLEDEIERYWSVQDRRHSGGRP